MKKEFEALDRLLQSVFNECDSDEVLADYNCVKQALTELKAIKEVEPSEAMEWIDKHIDWNCKKIEELKNRDKRVADIYDNENKMLVTIKQALLKAQEDKRFIELILNKPQLINVFAFDGVHTWEEFEDTFSDEDKEYINTTKEEFEYMRNQLIKRGKIDD